MVQQESKEELKAAAFEVLLLHNCDDKETWKSILLEQYGTEVTDVCGYDKAKIDDALSKLWEERYHDTYRGEEHTYNQWAEILKTIVYD